MGHRATFFRPYLSGLERDRSLVKLGFEYLNRFDRYRTDNPDIAGIEKFLYQLVLNDAYDKSTQHEEININDYNFFKTKERVTGCDYYDKVVKELACRVLCSDPLGTNLYFNSIFGLSMFDLYEVDYLTFKEYDAMAIKISEEFIKEMQAKRTRQNNAKNGHQDFII